MIHAFFLVRKFPKRLCKLEVPLMFTIPLKQSLQTAYCVLLVDDEINLVGPDKHF